MYSPTQGFEVSFLIPNDESGTRRIKALVWGDIRAIDKPVVFCLHGFQDNANSFYKVGSKLARDFG